MLRGIAALFFGGILASCALSHTVGLGLDGSAEDGEPPECPSCEPDGEIPDCSLCDPSCVVPGTSVLAFDVTGLRIPQLAEVAGFDLDEHHTTSRDDPVGCGWTDEDGGIDNAFEPLTRVYAAVTGGFDLNQILSRALDDGHIDLRVELRDYDGPSDELVVVTVRSGGEPVEGVEWLCTSADEQGRVLVRFPQLTLAAPEAHVDADGHVTPLRVPIDDVVLAIDVPEASPPKAVLGGAVRWTAESIFQSDFVALVIAAYDPDAVPERVVEFIDPARDLGPRGDCHSLSLGMTLALTSAESAD